MLTSVVEGLTRAAARFGSKPALQTAAGPLSYEDLKDRATRLASALRNRAVQPGDRVTLYAANCADWVVSYYGVQMAGAVVNPVNAMLTPEEVGFVVRDCGSHVIVGSPDKLRPLLPLRSNGAVSSLICFGPDVPEGMLSLEALLQARDTDSAPVPAQPDDTSTICYTSGTTGHPKGAMQSHRSVLMNASLTALMHGRQASDIVVTALPLVHVYGTVVMNSMLLNGGTLVLIRSSMNARPRQHRESSRDAVRGCADHVLLSTELPRPGSLRPVEPASVHGRRPDHAGGENGGGRATLRLPADRAVGHDRARGARNDVRTQRAGQTWVDRRADAVLWGEDRPYRRLLEGVAGGRARRVDDQRAARDAGVLRKPAGHQGNYRVRRLAAYRRHCADRRRRLHLHRRSQEGHDPERGIQRLPGGA